MHPDIDRMLNRLTKQLDEDALGDFYTWAITNRSLNPSANVPPSEMGVLIEEYLSLNAGRRKDLPTRSQSFEDETRRLQRELGGGYSSSAPLQDSYVEEIPEIGAGSRGRHNPAEDLLIAAASEAGLTIGAPLALERGGVVDAVTRAQYLAEGYPQWAISLLMGSENPPSLSDIHVRMAFDKTPIQYQKHPYLISGFGASPLERENQAGKITSRQARTSKGQLGRSITSDPTLKSELERAFRAAVKENYLREVNQDRTVNTGVLLQAVEQGTLKDGTDKAGIGDALEFEFTIARLQGKPRPDRLETERRPDTHAYGAWVFQGRHSITSVNPMVFFGGSHFGWRKTTTVGPALPRPVLELTPTQIAVIDDILAKGITQDAQEWLTEVEGR